MRGVKGRLRGTGIPTDDPANAGPRDFMLFCVNTFDTDATAARLGPLVSQSTAVVMLADSAAQNPACSQQAGRRSACGLAAVEFPDVMLVGPPVCTTPGLGDLGKGERCPAHQMVVPDRAGLSSFPAPFLH